MNLRMNTFISENHVRDGTFWFWGLSDRFDVVGLADDH